MIGWIIAGAGAIGAGYVGQLLWSDLDWAARMAVIESGEPDQWPYMAGVALERQRRAGGLWRTRIREVVTGRAGPWSGAGRQAVYTARLEDPARLERLSEARAIIAPVILRLRPPPGGSRAGFAHGVQPPPGWTVERGYQAPIRVACSSCAGERGTLWVL